MAIRRARLNGIFSLSCLQENRLSLSVLREEPHSAASSLQSDAYTFEKHIPN